MLARAPMMPTPDASPAPRPNPHPSEPLDVLQHARGKRRGEQLSRPRQLGSRHRRAVKPHLVSSAQRASESPWDTVHAVISYSIGWEDIAESPSLWDARSVRDAGSGRVRAHPDLTWRQPAVRPAYHRPVAEAHDPYGFHLRCSLGVAAARR
jgi:hypothetical protein